MRESFSLNMKWAFCKGTDEIPVRDIPAEWYFVNLPHTWNEIDGQDGGNDYYRGRCMYAKKLFRTELPSAERYYLEVCGAALCAEVYLNGRKLCTHECGYSTFRVEITEALAEENIIVIAVDNSERDGIYPQMADFTFYGGLYRDVNILCVGDSHIELEYYGTSGVFITPEVIENNARVDVKTFVKNKKEGQRLRYSVLDDKGEKVASLESSDTTATLLIRGVRLWHGRRDPYTYILAIELLAESGEVIDRVTQNFGCRSFTVDPERGFILNGEEYPLRGVSRHQDRWGIGNALLPEHHREDIEFIDELGATTVRLAHYQHDSYFYHLCDGYGLVVWAEIPYISKHQPSGRENTLLAMKELVLQNYNHPSIAFWGLSNEITMSGEADDDLIENHRLLNDLCHELDPMRLTAIAAVSPCPIDSPYIKIPDVVAYNHYFGWYGGDTDMNGAWFDKFHAAHPNIPIGCSEYGCEALNWHTSSPEQGDYTEEYQAYYHEELIKQLFSRKYLFATYVWNMFDFGADARCEGGEHGQNHKGLVTFDRSYKKDAFYAYKAWLSDKPFVHITGKRYADRAEDVTRVTVYSNQPEVELFANGVSVGKKKSAEHFFYFDVPLSAETKIFARAGECTDETVMRRVEKFNEAYRLREAGAILNWFDITEIAGRLSLNSKMKDILAVPEAQRVIERLFGRARAEGGFDMNGPMRDMLGSFTLLRLVGMLGMMGVKPTKEELLDVNRALNKIEMKRA